MRKVTILLLIVMLFTLAIGVSSAFARNSRLTEWQTQYPSSTSDDKINTLDGKACRLCHETDKGGDGWNPYGWALRERDPGGSNPPSADHNSDSTIDWLDALIEIEGDNSDGDTVGPYTNLEEIGGNAQPGWTTGSNTIYYKDLSTGSATAPAVTPLDDGPDTVDPDTTITDPTGGQTLSGTNYLITGTASDNVGVSQVEVSTDGGSTWNLATGTTSWSYNWTLPSSDGGGFTIQARATDTSSNVDPTPASVSVFVDNVAPSGSIAIDAGATYTNTTSVSVDNSILGATQMQFSNDDVSYSAWEAYGASKAWTLTAGDGTKTVWGNFGDDGTLGSPLNEFKTQDTIILDTTAPTEQTKSPASGATGVLTSSNVTFTFDEANEMDDTTIVNTGTEATSTFYLKETGTGNWVNAAVSYSAGTMTATLNPDADLNASTEYTAFMTNGVADKAGNTFAGTSWSFTTGAGADVTPPDTTISDPTEGQTLNSGDSPYTISGTASDDVGVSQVEVSTDGGTTWNLATGTTSWTYSWTLPSEDGVGHNIQARAADTSSNVDPTPDSVNVTVDTVGPSGSMVIDGDATYTNTTSVTLDNSVSGAAEMRFSNDGGATWSGWEGYAASKAWTLTAGDGTKTVDAEYRDGALNVFSTQDTIILDTTAPTEQTKSPAAGATGVSPSTTVTFQFDEAGEIDETTIVNTGTEATSTFYLKETLTGNWVNASVSYNAGSKTATLTPSVALADTTEYTAYMTNGVADKAGNAFLGTSWSFTTGTAGALPARGPHLGGKGIFPIGTDSCAGCHRAHSGEKDILLKKAGSTADFCFSCHDGTGANTNAWDGIFMGTLTTETDFGGGPTNTFGTPNAGLNGGGFNTAVAYTGLLDRLGAPQAVTSRHDALSDTATYTMWGSNGPGGSGPGYDTTLTCVDCHNPHGSTNYRILHDSTKTAMTGNAFPDGVESNEDEFGGTQSKSYTTYSYKRTLAGAGKIATWCVTCHERYLTGIFSADPNYDAGDGQGAVDRYRHEVDTAVGYAAELNANTPLPTEQVNYSTAIQSSDYKTCLTCHQVHGTEASMSAQATVLPTNDSALLRLDNRGVCEDCHQK